jgi:hypothetical protein
MQNPKDIFISPKIVEQMVANYKLPKQSFELEETLKALAHNKHNDMTTTYYLLHKKWLNSNDFGANELVKISPENYE